MKVGDTRFVEGYEFRAVRVWQTDIAGRLYWRFFGKCTADPRNDSIRGTGYDGAVYSGGLVNPETLNYWTARNALVDALRAVKGTPGIDKPRAEWTADEIAALDRYGAALAALKAFDAEHGGAPLL